MEVILICLFILTIIVLLVPNNTEPRKTARAEAKQTGPEKTEPTTDEIIRRHKKALTLVRRCREEGITSLYSDDDASNLYIIAESMGIKSKEEAVKLYSEGKMPNAKTLEALRQSKAIERMKCHKSDLKKVTDRLADYPPGLVGKEKYTAWASELETYLEKSVESYANSSALLSSNNAALPTPQKSLAREAMKGQLIGGPGVAVAKTLSAQDFNARSAATSKQLETDMVDLANKYASMAKDMEKALKITKTYLADIGNRYIDTEHSEKYSPMVKGHVSNVHTTFGGNLEFDVSFEIDGEPEILGKEAFLDGTVDIIANLGNKTLGRTTYCPPLRAIDSFHTGPVFHESVNLPDYSHLVGKDWESIDPVRYLKRELDNGHFISAFEVNNIGRIYAGFTTKHTCPSTVIIPTTVDVSKEDISNIEFEIVPRKVWAIQGGRKGLLYDFSPLRK